MAQTLSLVRPTEAGESPTWMLRINRLEAFQMNAEGTLQGWLHGLGLDTEDMLCREDGDDLIYEGARS